MHIGNKNYVLPHRPRRSYSLTHDARILKYWHGLLFRLLPSR